MKKTIISILLLIVMLCSISTTAFAISTEVLFESSYDADTGLVSVSLYITNPIGLESADLKLAYDPDMYSYVDFTDDHTGSATVVAGKSVVEDGLCTCSLIFMESCAKEDLDEDGKLPLATYQFKPLKDEYDIDDFCSWATSFQLSGYNVVNDVNVHGNENLKVGHTYVVTVQSDNSSKNSGLGSKWYIYVIAAVLAVGAIVGIAIIAVKNGQKADAPASDEEKQAAPKTEPETDTPAPAPDAGDPKDDAPSDDTNSET